MNSSMTINIAFCLPLADIEALSKGRMIVALSSVFINSVQRFILCPVDKSGSSPTISTDLWAKLECCKIYNDAQDIDKISQLTIWSSNALQKTLQERYKIFLVYLRVYRLNQAVEIPRDRVNPNKMGGFIRLPNYLSPVDNFPVLSDHVFQRRKQQLINLELPLHPELEELQYAVSQLANDDLIAENFNKYIQRFLGWTSTPLINQDDPKLLWISTIASLGDRSIEAEIAKKNTYEAGTDFENIVRQSLKFLGFKIEEDYNGGAGGLDLFCSKPYSLAGECKAGKSIPDRAVEELDRIGKRHLGKDYMKAVRLIIGSGQPTKQLRASAITSEISIISAMTLQKLVELQAKYPDSVNLIELKKYLEPGQIDGRIDEYISKVEQEIKVRIHLVEVLKKYQEEKQLEAVGIERLCGVYDGSSPPRSLNEKELYEILVELSSPLVGKLGRLKQDGKDRFYFLRDLVVD